jgi:4-diphosphocytidyl-2-C-methyl-D-erythritol kinase
MGRGEVLSGVEVDLDGFFLALIIPSVHVNTAEAYRMLTPAVPETDLREVIALPVEDWKDNLINDFEGPVMERFNEIREIKERLYGLGAVYASMSGSGSAVFGLFENPVQISGIFPTGYFTFVSQL